MTNNGGGGRGGSRPGSGRKPKHNQPADKRLMVRLTADQWAKLVMAADASNMAPSELVRKWVAANCN